MGSKTNTPKLVVIDLDGTLLHDGASIISARSSAALAHIQSKGIKLIFASGRSIRSINKVCRLSAISPNLYIAYNGAIVYDPFSRKKLKVNTLNVSAAREFIFEMLKVDGSGFATEVAVNADQNSPKSSDEEGTKFSADSTFIEIRKKHIYYEVDEFSDPLELLNDLEALEASNTFRNSINDNTNVTEGITKILVVNKTLSSSQLFDLVPKSFFSDDSPVTVVYSNSFQLEVSARGICKGNTLKWVCDSILGISSADVIAFGDMLNDVEMLQYAGIGVAMGNAMNEVKKTADRITLSNDEDGVAVELESIFDFKFTS
ncbi:hypothetical protein HK096_006181 [Nowakowskiella sp. JEL0078]|nr:hypothetical protein HK096_006181 [Nowakowskiella sp. JEL0078]